jgi:uncharacterized damage-inducible protein DinB
METAERELALHHLAASRERLLRAVEGLAPEQRSYRPAEDRWSVADCVEHIILVERFVLASVERILTKTPEPEKQSEVVGKEKVILERVPSRDRRVKGPEAVMPTQRWPEFEALLGEFEATRQRSVSFTGETQADLRSHFFPHPFLGDFDCYQWLLFIGTHCERHVRQLEEVKSDAGFPRSMAAGS